MEIHGKLIKNRYKIDRIIKEDYISRCYLARDISRNDSPLVISFLKNEAISHRIEDIIRFRMEIYSVSELEYRNIIKIYNIGEFIELQYMAMEYLEGRNLNEILMDEQPDLVRSINIITQLCKGLEFIHSRNIIHKNINPFNVVVNDSRVVLTGFGLFHVQKFDDQVNMDGLMTTLRYLAPEQCRILISGIDERTDLYSIGVLFYRLLVGKDPFYGRDVNAIIFKHLTKVPERPRAVNPAVPEILDRIVMKLLKKDPGDRYQSARGLLADLEKWSSGHEDFILGIDDRIMKLSYRCHLVGRSGELNRLIELFNRSRGGRGGVCFLTGQAGSGKTRLLSELKQHIFARGGMVIEGKCSVHNYKVPYEPLKEIMNTLNASFNLLPEDKRHEIAGVMREEFGNFGDIITKLNPNMKKILGEYPHLPPLDPDRETRRFHLIIVRFLLKISDLFRNLVIVFEDLQWADEGTLALFSELLNSIRDHPLAVIGSYRSDEVTDAHSLARIRRESEQSDLPFEEIAVENLDPSGMGKLVAALLVEPESRVGPISDFINIKSRGNPLFAIEILKRLVEEKVLARKNDAWSLDYDKLNTTGISDTAVDIILSRIRKLTDREMHVLSCASVIGVNFDIKLLFAVSNLDNTDVVQIVDRAIDLQLLENIPDRSMLRFVHDRIKEAFYSNIDPEKRRELHLAIANAIEDGNSGNIDPVIFDLAHHCIEAGDRERALLFSYPAGLKAMKEYANEDALNYFRLTQELLKEFGQVGTRQWVTIQMYISRIHLNLGNYDEVIEMLDTLLPILKIPMEKAESYSYLCNAYLKKGDLRRCEEAGRAGLKLLGMRYTDNRALIFVSIFKELLVQLIHVMFPLKYGCNVETYDEIWNCYGKITLALIWSYALSDIPKFIQTILRALNVAEKYLGKSQFTSMARGGFGAFLMAIPLFKQAVNAHKRALSMRTEINDRWGIAQSFQWLGFCHQWKGEYRQGIECFKQSADIFREIGDIWEYGFSVFGKSMAEYFSSDYTSAMSNLEEYYRIAQKSKDNYGICVYGIWMAKCLLEQGDFTGAEIYGKESFRLSGEIEFRFLYCEATILLGNIYFEKGEIGTAIEYLKTAREQYEKSNFLKQYSVHLYPLLAEAVLSDYMSGADLPADEKRKYLKNIGQLCRKALGKTNQWPSYYGISLLAYAKYCAVKGKNVEAEESFLRSIRHNKGIGCRYNLARSYFEYGLFISEVKGLREARYFIETAYSIFIEIGSEHYIRRISNLLGLGDPKDETTSIGRLIDSQRAASIVQITRELNTFTDFNRLLDAVISRAVEITGAERGIIFIASRVLQLEIRASIHVAEEHFSLESVPMRLVEEVFHTGMPVIAGSAAENAGEYSDEYIRSHDIKSILCAPIRGKDTIIGVCYLDNSLTGGVFSDKERDILVMFLSHVTLAAAMEAPREYSRKDRDAKTSMQNVSVPTEKIMRAMDFINQNYRSDISREGIAALVGMHHDNLSKYFSVVSGKKLNDYINELRIKDAIDKLSNSDLKIIDIAFAVGFSSVSTFNKAFRKIMKVSPEEFRNTHR